jgi:signal transduction histidine kinase
MVVDDDFDVLFTVSANLAAVGFSVSRFNTPESALEALKDQNFDVVLSDINMPRITGMDILEAVKKSSPDTPLIFMTGYADLDTALQAIKRGAFDLLTKPVDYELLKIVIEKALKIRNARVLELNYQSRIEDDLLTRTAELRNSMELLGFTNSRLESAMEVKDRFLSTISHELRTPMNGVVGALSLMTDSVTGAENLELLDIASSSAAEMCSIVDRIISFTALKTSHVSSSIVKFTLYESMSAAVANSSGIAERRGLDFSFHIDPSVPAVLQGDLESYLLVLDCLVSNAVKFTSKGSIKVSLTAVERDDGCLKLLTAIKDTGIGIPVDKYEKIFEEFVQGDGSRTRAYVGLGIGLNTAQLVVEKVNGRLWFESREGEGSDFYFTFPFELVNY